jgi:large subunit ribosomal protein L15
MPLVRRVPKRGFTNEFRVDFSVVNVSQLGGLGAAITPDLLVEHGLARRGRPIKVLGNGNLQVAVKVSAHKFSRAARAKIEAAGGSCEELG